MWRGAQRSWDGVARTLGASSYNEVFFATLGWRFHFLIGNLTVLRRTGFFRLVQAMWDIRLRLSGDPELWAARLWSALRTPASIASIGCSTGPWPTRLIWLCSAKMVSSNAGTRMNTAKQDVAHLLNKLPDDCSVEDIQYHLYVLEKVRRGLEDAQANGTLSQQEVDSRLSKWLTE